MSRIPRIRRCPGVPPGLARVPTAARAAGPAAWAYRSAEPG